MTRTRLTPNRLAEILTSLSDRDRAIATTVGNLRLVCSSQLRRLLFTEGSSASNARQARRALQRLVDLQVLTRLERRIGGVRRGSAGFIYRLGVVGQHIVQISEGRRRRPGEPGLPFVRHTLAISEVYVRLAEAARAGEIELIEFTAEPRCWRTYFGAGGAHLRLKPDAFVRIGRGQYEELFFLEVDCATHGRSALAAKFRAYRSHWSSGREQGRWDGVYPVVLWLVPTVTRLRQLLDVAGDQPPESWQLFTVRLFDEAIGLMTGEPTS